MQRDQQSKRIQIIGRVVAIIGFLLPLISTIFGGGFPFRSFVQPRIITETTQLVTGSLVLSGCTVVNNGRTNAENVTINITSKENAVFNDATISGAEGVWDDEGGAGETQLRVSLDRLVAAHDITIVVSTDMLISLDCQVAFDGGSVMPAESAFSLRVGDFAMLTAINGALLWIILRWDLNIRRENINRDESEESDESSS